MRYAQFLVPCFNKNCPRCFNIACFSLFNLQGTSALQMISHRGDVCYIITASSICQELFSTFFEVFQNSQKALYSTTALGRNFNSLSQRARVYYRILPHLSTPFFIFSQKITKKERRVSALPINQVFCCFHFAQRRALRRRRRNFCRPIHSSTNNRITPVISR